MPYCLLLKLKYYLIKSSNKMYVISFHNYYKLSQSRKYSAREKKKRHVLDSNDSNIKSNTVKYVRAKLNYL